MKRKCDFFNNNHFLKFLLMIATFGALIYGCSSSRETVNGAKTGKRQNGQANKNSVLQFYSPHPQPFGNHLSEEAKNLLIRYRYYSSLKADSMHFVNPTVDSIVHSSSRFLTPKQISHDFHTTVNGRPLQKVRLVLL